MAPPSTIDTNVVAMIQYTLKNDAGEILDTSVGQDPLVYLHGHGNIVPGLENALAGKQVGDRVTVSVPPDQGYGVRDADGMRSLDRHAFPPDANLEPGTQFMAEMEDGEVVAMWIMEVDDDHVHVDLNHPLAGMTLHFEAEVLGLRPAMDVELAHGHPHGPTGHEGHGHHDHDDHDHDHGGHGHHHH